MRLASTIKYKASSQHAQLHTVIYPCSLIGTIHNSQPAVAKRALGIAAAHIDNLLQCLVRIYYIYSYFMQLAIHNRASQAVYNIKTSYLIYNKELATSQYFETLSNYNSSYLLSQPASLLVLSIRLLAKNSAYEFIPKQHRQQPIGLESNTELDSQLIMFIQL